MRARGGVEKRDLLSGEVRALCEPYHGLAGRAQLLALGEPVIVFDAPGMPVTDARAFVTRLRGGVEITIVGRLADHRTAMLLAFTDAPGALAVGCRYAVLRLGTMRRSRATGTPKRDLREAVRATREVAAETAARARGVDARSGVGELLRIRRSTRDTLDTVVRVLQLRVLAKRGPALASAVAPVLAACAVADAQGTLEAAPAVANAKRTLAVAGADGLVAAGMDLHSEWRRIGRILRIPSIGAAVDPVLPDRAWRVPPRSGTAESEKEGTI